MQSKIAGSIYKSLVISKLIINLAARSNKNGLFEDKGYFQKDVLHVFIDYKYIMNVLIRVYIFIYTCIMCMEYVCEQSNRLTNEIFIHISLWFILFLLPPFHTASFFAFSFLLRCSAPVFLFHVVLLTSCFPASKPIFP